MTYSLLFAIKDSNCKRRNHLRKGYQKSGCIAFPDTPPDSRCGKPEWYDKRIRRRGILCQHIKSDFDGCGIAVAAELCGLALVRSADIRTGCDAGAEAVLPEQNAYEKLACIGDSRSRSSAEHVFSSDVLSDGEAQQLQADCREIAACYQDLYQQAEKVPSITMAGEEILLQGDIDRIEDRLARAGLCGAQH